MATKRSARVSRVGVRRQIAIPKPICDALHLGIGDFVAIEQRNGTVVIMPQKPEEPDNTLSPEEEDSVRRGTRDVAAGRVVPWGHYKKTHDLSRKLGRKSR